MRNYNWPQEVKERGFRFGVGDDGVERGGAKGALTWDRYELIK